MSIDERAYKAAYDAFKKIWGTKVPEGCLGAAIEAYEAAKASGQQKCNHSWEPVEGAEKCIKCGEYCS